MMGAAYEKEMMIRGYSKKTIEAYQYYNAAFLSFIRKSPREVGSKDVKAFLYHMAEKKHAPASINLARAALKSYYHDFCNKKLFSGIRSCKGEKTLARVLSRCEIDRMIEITKNPKHRLLIMLMYSAGLRVGECVGLKVADIDKERKAGFVRQGKGRKDRIFLLSSRFLAELEAYLAIRKSSSSYVFGRNTSHITIRAAEQVTRQAARIAGITRRVHPHMLRASFATHLFEQGAKELHIQQLMGHAHRGTTYRYISSSAGDALRVQSPLDAA